MKAFYNFVLIISLSAFLFTSCEKGDDGDIIPVYLEDFSEYTAAKPMGAADIKGYLEQSGQTELSTLATRGIKIYRLNYKTAFEGDSITASGLVAVPVPVSKKDAFPILSYQHSVIISNNDAPSVNPQKEATEMATFIASTGYIVIMPDYIGYGSSSEHFHPFLYKPYMTNAVLDFIRAAKEFIATEKPCKTNGTIFLSGFGEGAGATLAALNAIETDSVKNSDLKIKATACASGLYNLISFREWMVTQQKFDQPWYLSYMFESFRKYAGLTTDYSLIFNKPFASLIPGMVDGIRTGDQMNDMFGTKSMDELLTKNYKTNAIFNSDTSVYAEIKQIYTDNSIPAWALKSSLNIYYGKSDIWIPAEQSLYIYNDFRHLGATSNLKINALDGLNHETAVIPSLVKSVTWFRTF